MDTMIHWVSFAETDQATVLSQIKARSQKISQQTVSQTGGDVQMAASLPDNTQWQRDDVIVMPLPKQAAHIKQFARLRAIANQTGAFLAIVIDESELAIAQLSVIAAADAIIASSKLAVTKLTAQLRKSNLEIPAAQFFYGPGAWPVTYYQAQRTLNQQCDTFLPLESSDSEGALQLIRHDQGSVDAQVQLLHGAFGLANAATVGVHLATNQPVIVQRDSVLAPFVIENGVGIVLNDGQSVEDVLTSVTPEAYQDFLTNAERLGVAVRSQLFVRKALSDIMVTVAVNNVI